MSIDLEGDTESQNLKGKSGVKPNDRKVANDDIVTYQLMRIYYMANNYGMLTVKAAAIIMPIVLMIVFSLFISKSKSNLIAFFALLMSIEFILVSIWMLCWILEKDQGTRKMQEVSDPIKEGSEGFFVT